MRGPIYAVEDTAVRRFLAEGDSVSLGVETLMFVPMPDLLVNLEKTTSEAARSIRRLRENL